jgi:hypothetical protein
MRPCEIAPAIGGEVYPCPEPATHALRNPAGELKFFCAAHYDSIVAHMREWEFSGEDDAYVAKIAEVRRMNPGVL